LNAYLDANAGPQARVLTMEDSTRRNNGVSWRKIVVLIFLTSVSSAFLLIEANGGVTLENIAIPGAFFFLFIFLTAWIYASNRLHKRQGAPASKVKAILDAISTLSVGLFFVCPWWIYFDASNGLYAGRTARSLPISALVFMINGLPFLFGMIWLSFRITALQRVGQLRISRRAQKIGIFCIVFILFGLPLLLMRLLAD
jgi:hypothetical protein